jgi:hypothetical protein
MATALEHKARRHVERDHDLDTPTPGDGPFSDTVINPRMQRVKRRRIEDTALQTLVADRAFGGTVPLRPWRRP